MHQMGLTADRKAAALRNHKGHHSWLRKTLHWVSSFRRALAPPTISRQINEESPPLPLTGNGRHNGFGIFVNKVFFRILLRVQCEQLSDVTL
jgi:hypothetical protein